MLHFILALSLMFIVTSFLSYALKKRLSLSGLFLYLKKQSVVLSTLYSSIAGALTPFCVCTTIPIFVGMIQSGINTSVAMSFLFSSPLLSFSAIILISYLFGVKFSFFYLISALILSVFGGLAVYWLKFEDQISDNLRNGCSCKDSPAFVYGLFKNLLLPLAAGTIVAGFIYNYIPVKTVMSLNRFPVWISIPVLALIGFPIYSNIMVLAPICFSLADKGLNQAAVMTFMMSSAGISLPTTILLKKLLKTKLFLFYIIYTFVAYCAAGFVFYILS